MYNLKQAKEELHKELDKVNEEMNTKKADVVIGSYLNGKASGLINSLLIINKIITEEN